MAKQSHPYAAGRISVMERGLLGKSGLDRLLATQTVDEFYRALAELGWGDAYSQSDVEKIAANRIAEAYEFVRQNTPEPEVTDCFFIEYDVHNLKTLFKAKALGENISFELSPNGLIPRELLRACVENGNYHEIPIAELRENAAKLEVILSSDIDPVKIDGELDRAMYRFINRRLAHSKTEAIKQYFSDKADLVNILIALRVREMGRGADFAEPLLVEGGKLRADDVLKLVEHPELLSQIVAGKPYASQMIKGLKAYQSGSGLAFLEKLREDYLLSIIRPHRYDPLSVLPVVGYLLAREREATAVRLILSARLSGFPSALLEERLREGYAN